MNPNRNTPAKPGRPFWKSKGWWTGLATLVGSIGAMASGAVPVDAEHLQALVPLVLGVAGGLFAMAESAGRTRLERQLQDSTAFLAVLAQTDSRPSATPPGFPHYTERELLLRAVRNAEPRERDGHRDQEAPLWARVSRAFGMGSSYSIQLCNGLGLDPHKPLQAPPPVELEEEAGGDHDKPAA